VQYQAFQIADCGFKQLKLFFEKHIDKEENIRTDMWKGYIPLKSSIKILTRNKVIQSKTLNYFIGKR